jgi:hypothetical protein
MTGNPKRQNGRGEESVRDPSVDEIETICRLLSRAGSVAALRRWIKLARRAPAKVRRGPGRRKGVASYGDTTLLLYAAALQKHYPSLKCFTAIKEVVETQWCLFSGHDSLECDKKVEWIYSQRYVDGGPKIVKQKIRPGHFRTTIFGASQRAHAKRLLSNLRGKSLAEFREKNCADPNQSIADKLAARITDDCAPRFLQGMGWSWGYTGRVAPFRGSLVLPTENKLHSPGRSVLLVRRQAI